VREGNYRIVYAIHDDILLVDIVKVGHRKDVYR
jgi:mRNA interferase RelE/StbE